MVQQWLPKPIKQDLDVAFTGLGMLRDASREGSTQRRYIETVIKSLQSAQNKLEYDYVISRPLTDEDKGKVE